MIRVPMTAQGEARLREELQELKSVARPVLSKPLPRRVHTVISRKMPSIMRHVTNRVSLKVAFRILKASCPVPRSLM